MALRSRLLLCAALTLAPLALAPSFIHAQRPALTKSVDEPGRTPYAAELNGVVCNNFGCFFQFKPVPAGFRLVVTHVSCFFTLNTYVQQVALLTSAASSSIQLYLPQPQSGGAGHYTLSAPVSYYVEPGQAPILIIGYATPGTIGDGSIIGYLVALD